MGVYDKDIKRDIDAINALLKGVKPSKKVMLEDFPLQQIYYGAPGTGKSFELKEVTKGYSTIRTTFHPDSDYSTFVGVYKRQWKRHQYMVRKELRWQRRNASPTPMLSKHS